MWVVASLLSQRREVCGSNVFARKKRKNSCVATAFSLILPIPIPTPKRYDVKSVKDYLAIRWVNIVLA